MMSCNQISPTPNLARPAAANNAEKRPFFLGHSFVDFRSTKANIKEKGYFETSGFPFILESPHF